MRYVILVLLFYSLIQLYLLSVFLKKRQKIAQKSAISSLGLIWLIFLIDYICAFYIPDIAYFLVILSFFFNTFLGYYCNLFTRSKRYDRFQHLFGCFSFAIILYFLSANIFDLSGTKSFHSFYIFLLGIFSGVFTEILEFLYDLKHEEKMQKGLQDTNVDMVFDVIGSMFSAIFAFLFLIK